MTEPTFYTLGPLPEVHFGSFSISTYFLWISLSTCLCIYWYFNRCENRNLPLDQARNLAFLLLITGFVGARLTHVFFEAPQYYLKNPIEIFSFWQGGFVFYGAVLTAYLFSYLYLKNKKKSFWLWHDTLAPVIALGYALGRISCFLVGCCYGKVCDLPWAYPLKQVHISSENITFLLRHPTQLYGSLSEFLILIFLLLYEKRRHQLGRVFLIWVMLHSTNRILMEFFRDDPRGPTLFTLSLSTHLSILFILLSSIVLIYRQKKLN